ncbi:hypothetical protein [Abditibacterium utsteinense]|uniref:hypothetical protein n=1 Tax=Abditibacterium utsteinense TaxID=1960156 RepID=UPI000F46724C|nr:hypothetical protein [Abditibacterium utsteinense]
MTWQSEVSRPVRCNFLQGIILNIYSIGFGFSANKSRCASADFLTIARFGTSSGIAEVRAELKRLKTATPPHSVAVQRDRKTLFSQKINSPTSFSKREVKLAKIL